MGRSIKWPHPITIFASHATLSFQDECCRSQPERLKLVHVIIPQTRQDEFVQKFLNTFRETDWSSHKSGDDWPTE
jgi:hypothetical protein